jgi:hypothetical protein
MMSRFEGYSEEQKARIKATGCKLVEARIEGGTTPCTDAGVRQVMPECMETARLFVVALDEELNASRFDNYVVNSRDQIRAVSTKLAEGQLVRGTVTHTEEAIKAAVRQAVEDARRAVIAVDEFLCG